MRTNVVARDRIEPRGFNILKCKQKTKIFSSLFPDIYYLQWLNDVGHKRKIYDTRNTTKSSYHSYNHHTHHHQNNDYTPSSTHRRGNRFGGFTFRGLFEPTPFYKFFGTKYLIWQMNKIRIFNLFIICLSSRFGFVCWMPNA